MNETKTKHGEHAQNGLHYVNGVATNSCALSRTQLYRIPRALVQDVADAVEIMLS